MLSRKELPESRLCDSGWICPPPPPNLREEDFLEQLRSHIIGLHEYSCLDGGDSASIMGCFIVETNFEASEALIFKAFGSRKNVLPALLQKLVGDFFCFSAGKFGGKFRENFAGFF